MRVKIKGLLAFLLVLSLLPPLASFWVREEMSRRTKIKIQGRFEPLFFLPVFYLKDVHLEWSGKVAAHSGDLRIEFDPFFFLRPDLRVKLSSQNLSVTFLGDWAKNQGVRSTELKVFEADLALGREGIREIYSLEARSPEFQFHLEKSEDSNVRSTA